MPKFASCRLTASGIGVFLGFSLVRAAPTDTAGAVDPVGGSAILASAMQFLGHEVPTGLCDMPIAEFWRWAVSVWSITRVPAVRAIFPGGHVL